jgi:hypothetical protein
MSEHSPEQADNEIDAVDETAAVPQAGESATDLLAAADEITRNDAPSINPVDEGAKSGDPDSIKPEVQEPEAQAGKIERAETTPARLAHDSVTDLKRSKLMVLPFSDRSWDHNFRHTTSTENDKGPSNARQIPVIAAVIVLAATVGAISGSLATIGTMNFTSPKTPVAVDNSALESSVARTNADIAALRTNLDRASKVDESQFKKAADRLDKLEKVQAESQTKLVQLSGAVDKLRAPPTVSAPAATKEITGSIMPTRDSGISRSVAATSPKIEADRLPTVEGWRLVGASNGGAFIEGRSGTYEVYPGDPVPGLGRIDAIRRQDGRWVVVTSKGLIVAR